LSASRAAAISNPARNSFKTGRNNFKGENNKIQIDRNKIKMHAYNKINGLV